jgi:hypothetical protein
MVPSLPYPSWNRHGAELRQKTMPKSRIAGLAGGGSSGAAPAPVSRVKDPADTDVIEDRTHLMLCFRGSARRPDLPDRASALN